MPGWAVHHQNPPEQSKAPCLFTLAVVMSRKPSTEHRSSPSAIYNQNTVNTGTGLWCTSLFSLRVQEGFGSVTTSSRLQMGNCHRYKECEMLLFYSRCWQIAFSLLVNIWIIKHWAGIIMCSCAVFCKYLLFSFCWMKSDLCDNYVKLLNLTKLEWAVFFIFFFFVLMLTRREKGPVSLWPVGFSPH